MVRFMELATPHDLEGAEGKETKVRRKPRKWVLQAIPLGLFFVLFLCVLIPFMQTRRRIEALRFRNGLESNSISSNLKPNMIISLSGMNTENYEITVTSVLNKVPQSVMSNDSTRIAIPFRIQVGTSVASINENTTYVNAPLTSKVPLLSGSLAWYPFDTYLMKLDIQAVTGTSLYNAGGYKPIKDLDFQVLMPDDFSWTYVSRQTTADDFKDNVLAGGTLSDPSTGYTSITVEITRDFNIYMALVFVGIWAVTISIGYIGSMSVIWKRRPADNPVIFVSALFAVPTFRNTAPGRPPYGCLFDVLCTYFSIGVIITFLVLVAFAYMKKQKTTKKPKKDDDDTIPVATLDAGVAGDVADAGVAADAAAVADA